MKNLTTGLLVCAVLATQISIVGATEVTNTSRPVNAFAFNRKYSSRAFKKPLLKQNLFIDYLPLTAGSGYPLTGTLYGTNAYFKPESGPAYVMLDATNSVSGRLWEVGTAYAGVGVEKFYVYDNTAMSARFVIDESGNTGIGTSSPAYKLDVNGTANFSGGINGISAVYKSATGVPTYITLDGSNTSTGRNWEIGTAYAGVGVKKFYVYDNTAYAARMVVDENGNVGIGENNPPERLSVDGNIVNNGFVKTKKVWVTPVVWSDYVFDEAYQLPTLSSVDQFIKRHRRLPDMPSAKDVEENGISIGDNQALLLKKVEELTLYIIEMNKENMTNRKLIRSLQAQVKKMADGSNK